MMSDQVPYQEWSVVLSPPPSGTSGLHGIAIWLFAGSLFFVGAICLLKLVEMALGRWTVSCAAVDGGQCGGEAVKPRRTTERARCLWWLKGWQRRAHSITLPTSDRAFYGYQDAKSRLDRVWRREITMKLEPVDRIEDARRSPSSEPVEERSAAA